MSISALVNIYGAVITEFICFISWMHTQQQVAANPQMKPINLGCNPACTQLLLTPTTAIRNLPIDITLLSLKANTVYWYHPEEHKRLSWCWAL